MRRSRRPSEASLPDAKTGDDWRAGVQTQPHLITRVLRRGGSLSGLILLVALVATFVILRQSRFIHGDNLMGIVKHSISLTLIAVGLTAVLVVGEFDLSFPAVVSVCCLLLAGLTQDGWPFGLALALALGVGVGVGLVNGYLVSVVGLASFVATIGTGGAITALALLYSDGQTLKLPSDSALNGLAHGDVFGVPTYVFLVFLALLFTWTLMERSELGYWMAAVGENQRASEVAGLSVPMVKISAFVVQGVMAALAAAFIVSDQGVGFLQAGSGFLFDAYAAVFLGAVTFRLGHFNLYGTVVGALVLGVLFNGLNLLGLEVWEVKVASGAALLMGLIFSRMAGEAAPN